MKAVVLGREVDVRGFALAGVDGLVCEDAGALAGGLRVTAADHEVGLLLLSAEAAALDPAAVTRFRRRPGAPLVLVLPPVGEAA
ncbi:MAG TPA: V-type ATP synthase subunit F [Vicinamibacteria bacterium]|jgi:vacuolar-type H+-ATPase subunit F/Vma7